MTSYIYRNVSEALPQLCQELLQGGLCIGSRNGEVAELLDTQVTLTHPWEREVLNLNRKANVFAQIAETCWVLSGRNDVGWLSAYLPRASDYADDGKHWRAGYGPRLRDFQGVDQLSRVVDALRQDPRTRQAVIQIWAVSDGNLDPSLKDRACNTQLQFQSRLGRLHLTVTVRSNDLMWGWSGINAFEWSVLQEIVASLLGVEVGNLTFNIGNLHLYGQHWKKADSIEYHEFADGVVRFNPNRDIETVRELDELLDKWFEWEGRCRAGDVTPGDLDTAREWGWHDPLFRTWAAAIAYFWTRDGAWLEPLRGTALARAIARSPLSELPEPVQTPTRARAGVTPTPVLSEPTRRFYEFVQKLHATKHASYGNSWKKRGELLSILPNIARKIDRLGVGDEHDSAADTWVDLWVYLVKYRCWLKGEESGPETVGPLLLKSLTETESVRVDEKLLDLETHNVVQDFNYYCDNISAFPNNQKIQFVEELINRTAPIARELSLPENGEGDEYRGADAD